MVDLKAKLSHHSEEIVEGFKRELNDVKIELAASEKARNKVLDEKLKIEEIIDKQIEQVEYWTNKANKLEDELALRKQIEESVTNNLKKSEEQIRILKLEKDEKVIKSFSVKFINIEESKDSTQVMTKGTVQTCQSVHSENDYFLRITYVSAKDKQVRSFRIEADRLGGIIPISDKRAAIQWKTEDGKMKKQEVEMKSPEELLLEIGNITYR